MRKTTISDKERRQIATAISMASQRNVDSLDKAIEYAQKRGHVVMQGLVATFF